MILPCETCKYRTERIEGHKLYVGCSDSEKRKFFHHDENLNKDICDAYVRDVSKKRHK